MAASGGLGGAGSDEQETRRAGLIWIKPARLGPVNTRRQRICTEGNVMAAPDRTVVWFEELGRTRRRPRRRQERVARRDGAPSRRARRRGAAGLRHHGRGLLALRRGQRAAARRSPRRSASWQRARRRWPRPDMIRAGLPARRLAGRDGRGHRRAPIASSASASAGPTPTSPCARAPPPRICPTRASPDSRRPSSTSAARRPCSTPAGAASPRSSPIAPSATGRPRASTI